MIKTNKGFALLIIPVLLVFIGLVVLYFFSKYNTLLLTPKPEFKTGIYGKVISDSDVQTLPDSPIANSLVVFYPLDNFSDWYNNLNNGIVETDKPYHDLQFTKTNIKGEYKMELAPNAYVLCFTFEAASGTTYQIQDCVEIEIQEDQLQKVNISRQFDTQFSCVTENTCTKIELPQLDTRDWKTYSDDTFKYQISYPSDWKLHFGQKNSVLLVPQTATDANLDQGSVIVIPHYQNTIIENDMTLAEYANNTQANLKESMGFEYESNELKTIGNNEFWLAEGGCCMDIGMHAFSIIDNYVYRITLSNLEGNITSEELNTFYKILSTFEFTD